MARWHAEVRVWLKQSVFDPQGHAVEGALCSLGQEGVESVRIGKFLQVALHADTRAVAEDKVRAMCETLFCNPVMEAYALTVHPAADDAAVEVLV